MTLLSTRNEKASADSVSTSRMPDFLIIGAAKSGTTTLYQYLLRHPGVQMPDLKEPEFFSRNDVYARGKDWYGHLFDEASQDQICGEASTTYSRWPHTADAAARIAKALPDVKLIYLMRDPVKRAYSHYAHHMRLGVTCTFEQALERSDEYVDCGLYMMQLNRYLRYFSRENILCLLTDDLHRNPGKVLNDVQAFLNLNVRDVSQPPIRANKGGADHYIRAKTTRRLRQLPGVNLVADHMPHSIRQFAYEVVRSSPQGKRLSQEFQLPRMQEATEKKLAELYSGPNGELAEFLGRDLSHWTHPR